MLRAAALLALFSGQALAAMDGGEPGLRVEGAELILQVGDTTLRGADLIGAELDIDGLGTLLIDAAEPDASARFEGIWLYRVRARAHGAADFEPFCEPDPSGDTRVLFHQGELDAALRYDPETRTASA